jgi:hypothetical protein
MGKWKIFQSEGKKACSGRRKFSKKEPQRLGTPIGRVRLIYKKVAMGSMEIMIFLGLQLLSYSICSLTKIVSSPDSGVVQKETHPRNPKSETGGATFA